jgi:hypothetical protein
MITQENITLAQRLTAPTPKFFRTLRTISLVAAAVGGALLAAPVLPVLATIGGVLTTAGTVAGAIASLPVDFNKLNQ